MKTTTWPEGIKKTKQREAIWSVLTSTDKPITAIEIAERLGTGSTTWMSTIYRTLELLETKDIITRTTLMGSDMAYYEITPHTPVSYTHLDVYKRQPVIRPIVCNSNPVLKTHKTIIQNPITACSNNGTVVRINMIPTVNVYKATTSCAKAIICNTPVAIART